MKRLFILASAAALMLASCAKTTVVYNEAPEEISFKKVTGAMTKTDPSTTPLTGDMGVIAYLGDDSYFTATQFSEDDGVWKASPARYYPIQGTLKFAYYSPFNADWSWNGTTTLTSGNYNSVNDTDVLYGTTIAEGNKDAGDAIAVTLGHALAKVTVNIGTDETSESVITINSVSFGNAVQGGSVTVTYVDDAVSNVVWEGTATPFSLIALQNFALDAEKYVKFNESYVVGAYNGEATTYSQGTLTVNYTMPKYADAPKEGDTGYDSSDWITTNATFDLNGYWNMGKNYIFNIKATVTEITFDAVVLDFVDVPEQGDSVTPNVTL